MKMTLYTFFKSVLNKTVLALCIGLFSFSTAYSQNNHIIWKASYKKISATEGEISINGAIDKGWHTYSQQSNDAVPFPTLLSFKESKGYTLMGKAEESNATVEFDAALNAKLLVFVGKVDFKQRVSLSAKGPQTIAFTVEYIVCDNKMCMPPTTTDLSVKIQ